MKRVLLRGMSGSGKSSVVRELVARGYKAVPITKFKLRAVERRRDDDSASGGRVTR